MLAFLGLSMTSAYAQLTYEIIYDTIHGYRAVGNGSYSGNLTSVQLAVDWIKGNAAGADCTIKFVSGTDPLNLSIGSTTTLITFDGGASGTDWGLVTLTGKATASAAMNADVIDVRNHASIDCKAEITGTGNSIIGVYNSGAVTISAGGIVTSTSNAATVFIKGGILTVNGGTVQALGNNTIAINAISYAVINIISGTVSATTNLAISSSYSTVNISGGAVSAITGTAITINYEGTVNISGGTVSATTGAAVHNGEFTNINISGGTVSATTGIAIDNRFGSTVNISGGTVSVTTGIAIDNGLFAGDHYSGTVNISGGTVSATTGIAVRNNYEGKITISDVALVTSEGKDNNGTITLENHGTNTGVRLEIKGGMVKNSSTTVGCAVLNQSCGAIEISGGTVSGDGSGCYAINNAAGAVNISGGTVSSTNGTAVQSNLGPITVSGGTVSGTSGSFTIDGSTITVNGGTVSATNGIAVNGGPITIGGGIVSATTGKAVSAIISGEPLTISGGTISATTGDAVSVGGAEITTTISGGTISVTTGKAVNIYVRVEATTISGGTISATTGYAVYADGFETTLSGGTLFAYGKEDKDVIVSNYTQSGDAVIVAWDANAGTLAYSAGTSDDIYKLPAPAKAVWAKQGSKSGISVAYNTNTDFIPIDGVTVTGAGVGTLRATSLQVYPNPTTGVLNLIQETFNNEQLTINNVEIYDIMGRKQKAESRKGKEEKGEVMMDISHFPAGVYFLRIETENKMITQKIIKN